MAALDRKRNLSALGIAREALLVVIVAVERDVHGAQRHRDPQRGMQPLGEPHSAGVEPDHGCAGRHRRLELGGELRAQFLGVR